MKRGKGKKKSDSGLGKAITRATTKKRFQKAPDTHEFLNVILTLA